MGDNAEGARLLCDAGCNPLARDPLGSLAISVACMFGSVAAFEELLALGGRLLEAADLADALHFSVIFRPRATIIQQLIDLGADINEQRKLKLLTPFGIAVALKSLKHSLGYTTPFTQLCYHHDGSTPLMAAILQGHYEGAAILITAGSNLDLRSARGWTAADFARQQSAPDFLVQALQGRKEACEMVMLCAVHGGYVVQSF